MGNTSILPVDYLSCNEHSIASNVKTPALATPILNDGINLSLPPATSLSLVCNRVDLVPAITHMAKPTYPAARMLQNLWNYTLMCAYPHTNHSIDQR
jgi:hypothetical protein